MSLLYRMGTGNGSGGDLKPYTVNFECSSGYIGQTLTMTYKGTPHAGETVDNVSGTVGSDGTLTLYPMHSGEWECSCYSSVIGTTMKKTIELTYWGTTNVEFTDTPNGATVTPTDDVQTWLKCAELNKSYTTISQVLADTNTLSALISDNNASDYLVRSTTWASDICNNESAMIYIGLNDYCTNKLLADSTWSTAILSSAYFNKILKALIPTMTSNTGSDGGEASASSIFGGGYAQYLPYKAFDNNDTTHWLSDNKVYDAYITYKFNKDVTIYFIDLINNLNDAYLGNHYSLYISADDNVILGPFEINSKVFNLPKQKLPPTKCKTLKIRVVGNANYVSLSTVQVYGREA